MRAAISVCRSFSSRAFLSYSSCVLRNTLVEPQVEEHGEPLTKLVKLATEPLDGVTMKLIFCLMPGLHVSEQRIQQFRRHLDSSEDGFDLIENRAFGNKELFIWLSRVAADQVDMATLLEVAGHRAARGRALDQPPEHERLLRISRRARTRAAQPNLFALLKQFFADERRVTVPVHLSLDSHLPIIEWIHKDVLNL